MSSKPQPQIESVYKMVDEGWRQIELTVREYEQDMKKNKKHRKKEGDDVLRVLEHIKEAAEKVITNGEMISRGIADLMDVLNNSVQQSKQQGKDRNVSLQPADPRTTEQKDSKSSIASEQSTKGHTGKNSVSKQPNKSQTGNSSASKQPNEARTHSGSSSSNKCNPDGQQSLMVQGKGENVQRSQKSPGTRGPSPNGPSTKPKAGLGERKGTAGNRPPVAFERKQDNQDQTGRSTKPKTEAEKGEGTTGNECPADIVEGRQDNQDLTGSTKKGDNSQIYDRTCESLTSHEHVHMDIKGCNEAIEKMYQTLTSEPNWNDQLEKAAQKHKAEKDEYERKIDELKSHSENNATQMKLLKEQYEKDRRDDVEKWRQELKKKDEQIKHLHKDNEELLSNYSKLASDNMRQNNPNVADLSDGYRTSVIADKYSQLYSDPWTKAYRILKKQLEMDEKQIKQSLLDALKDVFHYCQSLAKEQEDMLINIFQCPVQSIENQAKVGERNRRHLMGIHGKQLYALLELRKQIAVTAVEDVKENYFSHLQRKNEEGEKGVEGELKPVAEVKQVYCRACLDVCWPMALHNPPLYIQTEVKPGDPINEDIFNQTSGGDRYEKLVWPPLFLGKDGRCISKGAVEARFDKPLDC